VAKVVKAPRKVPQLRSTTLWGKMTINQLTRCQKVPRRITTIRITVRMCPSA